VGVAVFRLAGVASPIRFAPAARALAFPSAHVVEICQAIHHKPGQMTAGGVALSVIVQGFVIQVVRLAHILLS